LAYYPGSVTRGNKYKLLNNRFYYDLRKHYFSARIVNIWNSLPNHVVEVNTVNLFKARLDRFWANQDVKYDLTADITGIGDRSAYSFYICQDIYNTDIEVFHLRPLMLVELSRVE